MAISIYVNPASLTAAQYDDIGGRLDAAGAGKPAGRLYHACFGSGDKLQVFEIWESQQASDKFRDETLVPILQEIGLDPGQLMVEPVHNLIQG
jgi:hypothetical protein